MFSNTTKLSILGALILLPYSSLFAQLPIDGFYPKKGDLTIAPGYTFKTYDEYYVVKNTVELGEDTETSIFSFYAQYAISNRFSATVTLPYISTEKESDPSSKQNDLQDLGLYIKSLIIKKDFKNSSKISLGAATGITFPLSNYKEGGIISIGNQATSFDGEAIIHYETSFKVFAEASLGYSLRDNKDYDIPNALLYSFKVGYLHQLFYAHAKLDIQDSTSGLDIGTDEFGLKNSTLTEQGLDGALPETKVGYTNLSFTIYVPIYKNTLGLSANYSSTLDGRNFSKETAYGVGIVYNLNIIK